MELKLINADLPIVPMKNIGGVTPGNYIKHYQDALDNVFFRDITLVGVSHRVVCINYMQSIIRIYVDLFTGYIYKVEAGQGYLGSVANYNIKIGIYVRDLLKYFSNDWEDDGQYLWNINFPSLYFSFLKENNGFDSNMVNNYLDNKINKIGIIAPDEKGDYDFYGNEWYASKEKLAKIWVV